jgi:exodeoxyribonuclease V beta subunit
MAGPEPDPRSNVASFELTGPLPHGRMAIEASAGTGKTHALSTLATRYVAEVGVPVRELLIVTFTRAAASELKDRVRKRLVEAANALGSATPPEDEFLRHLHGTDRDVRAERVATALAEFDSATITTIHGFATQVLGTLGSNVGTDPDAVLVDDSTELITQVTTDVLTAEVIARERSGGDTSVLPALESLRRAASLVLGNPDSQIQPAPDFEPASDSEDPARAVSDRAAILMRELVDKVVTQVAAHRRRSGTLSFDDLLVRLRDALVDPTVGTLTRELLQQRFSVALIDEFQDTDPVQWAVFDTLFANARADADARTEQHPHSDTSALMLVGDPKQAIYAFRGANVHTYLQAVRATGTELTELNRNWRSDPAVLRATEALLHGVTFGDDRIVFHPVEVPEQHAGRRFTDIDGNVVPAVSLRLLEPEATDPRSSKAPRLGADDARRLAFEDLARHVRYLLERTVIPDEERTDGTTRALRPSDVAVLVPANAHGPMVRDALDELGIPAVMARGEKVLESVAAMHWHRLLYALEKPADARRARSAATSWFFDWDANTTAQANDEEVAGIQHQLLTWANHLRSRGVASLLGRVITESEVAVRVLARPDGERAMTDIEHVAELLSAAAANASGPVALLTAFEEMSGSSAATADVNSDPAARRVESEASAVQIMTTFVAKGLEFPVVCCPNLWHVGTGDDPVWWDETSERRMIDVASRHDWGSRDAKAERKKLAAEELAGTNLRVLYVALTRSRNHTALWWAPTRDSPRSALARVLFARDDEGRIDPELFAEPRVAAIDTETSVARLEPVVVASDGHLELVVVDPGNDTTVWAGTAVEHQPALHTAELRRQLDRARTRLSFSTITARGDHGITGLSDPHSDSGGDALSEDEGRDDATAGALPDVGDLDRDHPVLPLGSIPGGAAFGTLVHSVLEEVDFASPDLDTELRAAIVRGLARNPWPVDVSELTTGVTAVINTPLGPLFEGRSLADIERSDRLDEVAFDFTLGEGGNRASDRDVGALLLDHLEPADPHRRWAEKLAEGPFSRVLAGHLTGSIDLVARVRGADGTARFVVCDYKTNRLAPKDTDATAALFRPDRLVDAMAAHHYQLQALLYSVALHRYLRWRILDYDPDRHLGGIGYLFVRSMIGSDTPTVDDVPYGLAQWHPPVGLISDLSDLLDGSETVRAAGPSTEGTLR